MKQIKLATLTTASMLVALTFATQPAYAHINMSGAILSRGGDQKSVPCDGKRGDGPMYTFEPGATITLSVLEEIPHPSYFRIAFDNDGMDAFKEPKSIKPIDPARACPLDQSDQCGAPDYCNVVSTTGATVLWDNLEPHLAGGSKTYTWNVKLPDIECEHCVIQVIQVMEDTVHGAYCPDDSCTDTSGFPIQDLYHRCIDIKLMKGATNSPGTTTAPVMNQGIDCLHEAGGMGSAGSGSNTGGAGGASGSTATAGARASAGAGATSAAGSGTAGTAAGTSATTSTPTAGITATKPPATAGSAAVPTQTTSGSVAGGSAHQSASAAGVSAPPPTPSSSGGCSVGTGRPTVLDTAAWLVLAGLLSIKRRRRGER